MRSSDCDILIVPGWGGAGPEHWQSRWQRQLSTGRRPEGHDWRSPDRNAWAEAIVRAAAEGSRPLVVVAHGLGVVALAWTAPRLPPGRVRGAFLVAPLDVEGPGASAELASFAPMPPGPLPFPSVLVASRTDPGCTYERAEDLGCAWGSATVEAGDAGGIDTASGHGPWPEGLMRFAGFLKRL